jgi:phage terminase large subunit
MTSLPNYLQRQASLYRLQKARDRSSIPDIRPRIERAYGSVEAYEAFKREVRITPDHAANFERYGVVLQPKQMQFAVAARSADNPDGPVEVGMGGARGPGKSFGEMAQVALDDLQRWPGLKALYLRFTGKAAQEQLDDLVQSVLGQFPHKQVKRGAIHFNNGSRMLIGGFKDDREALSYQGLEYDILLIEELTQLREKTYKTLRLSERSSKMRDGVQWRPRTYYSMNPLGIGHQFCKKRFVDNERRRERGEAFDPRQRFIFATVDDNVFVGDEYRLNLEDLTGAELRAYRWGDWDVSAGAYFETWNEARHVVAPYAQIPRGWQVWASMDYGYNHWNVTHLHAVSGDGDVYTFEELAHRRMYPEEIAPDILSTLAQYGIRAGNLRAFVAGTDAFAQTGRSKETIAEQYQRHGLYLTPADMSPGSRVAGAHLIARLLGNPERDIPPRWFITSNCTRLRDCIPYLERDPHHSEDVRKVDANEDGSGGDDAYDAARYGLAAIEESRHSQVSIGFNDPYGLSGKKKQEPWTR